MCCEEYTAERRAPFRCGACAYTACRTCVRRYLSETSDMQCMSCGEELAQDSLRAQLPAKFFAEDLRDHRARVLAQRQAARLPGALAALEARRAAEARAEVTKLESDALWARVHELDRSRARDLAFAKTIGETGRVPEGEGGSGDAASARAFVRSCPRPGCEGFLSSAWKCAACGDHACPRCHAHVGPDRSAHVECDPAELESARAVEAESKRCPGCGSAISRVSGCDQMWCTRCNVAFSWRTGRKVAATAMLHNPHYLAHRDALRGAGGAQAPPAAPRPGECGRDLPRRVGYYGPPSPGRVAVLAARDLAADLMGRVVPELQAAVASEEDCDLLNMRFVGGEVSRAAYERELRLREKRAHVARARLQVLELVREFAPDILWRGMAEGADHETAAAEMRHLLDGVREGLRHVSKTFGLKGFGFRATGL